MRRTRSEWIGSLAAVVAGTLACSVVCALVLDLATTPFDPTGHVGSTVVSAIVLWCAIVLLACVTNRLWLAGGLVLSLCVVVTATSRAKYGVRDEPLYPADLDFLWQPGFLRDVAPAGAVLLVGVAAVGIVAAAVLLGRRRDRRRPRLHRDDDPLAWIRLLGLRVVVGLVSVLVLVQASQFNDEGNPVRAAYEAVGAEWVLWRQGENYSENGFLAGFLFNTYTRAMDRPPGYSAAAMQEIAARYERRAAAYNDGRDADELGDTNVVLLLSEAFSDPLRLDGVDLAEDPIPFVRRVMADNPSGQAVGKAIGGGTANAEFEALTGLSLALLTPQVTTPFQMLVPAESWMPSVAWYLDQLGHETVGVHPYLGSMYRRSAAYPRLGIDVFRDVGDLKGLEQIDDNPLASDASTFDGVVRRLEESRRPLFVNLVTMQNHFPYDGHYSDPIENSLDSDALGQYARGLAHSDAATEQLLADLSRSDEETLVVFFGDHLPGAVYDGEVIERNADRRTETPFFIWSSERDLPATRLPDTSPIFFMPLALDAVGAEVPPYYALLLDLHAEVPTLSTERPLDQSRLSPRARRLLHDFRLVQYDFSVGQRHVTGQMFHRTPSNR